MDYNYNDLSNLFYQKFGNEPLIIDAPGRINIIGEHTDYNDGFVLPAAIDKSVKIAIHKNDTSFCNLVAIDIYEDYSFSINEEMKPVNKQWVNYFLGLINELKEMDYSLGGFNLMFTSNIPVGSGLSSSAAIECGFGFALSELYKLSVSRLDLALIGQQAEHKFAGVKCGIMDQFASLMGKKGQVIQLDCRSLKSTYFPSDMDEYQIVLFDTQVKHNLADSEYNIRREQCELGVQAIKKNNPEVKALRDVSLQMLNELGESFDPVIYKRCKYVIEENNRVVKACKLLEENDVIGVGRLMFDTHDGLSNSYEVSCEELDYLVEAVKNHEGVIGARMMGGGFGGCTINLVKKSDVKHVVSSVEKEYKNDLGKEIKVYKVSISDGVKVIK